jgi:hypothetical protein
VGESVTEEMLVELERQADFASRTGDNGYPVEDVEALVAEVRRLRALTAPERFPILSQGVAKREELVDYPRSIPWAFIAPQEGQAQTNHDQSLRRLAERGGLSVCEALAVLDGKRLSFGRRETQADVDEMNRRVLAFEQRESAGYARAERDVVAHAERCRAVYAAARRNGLAVPDADVGIDTVRMDIEQGAHRGASERAAMGGEESGR